MALMPVVLATGGYDHKIRFWDATSGTCSKSINFPESQVNCLQISLDKSILAAGGNPVVHLFDIHIADEKPLLTYEGHQGNVVAVGFRKDMKWVYSGSEDGTLRIWDCRSKACTRKYDSGAPVNSVVLHPDQVTLLSGDQNGAVKVWDLVADKCREEHTPAPELPVRSVSIACDASFVAVGSHKGKVFLYTVKADKGLELAKEFDAHQDYLLKCVVSPDLQTIATTSADKSIRLWDTNTLELRRSLLRHQRWVWDCVFSVDSLYLLSASSDQSAKLWDLNTGDVVRNYVGHNLAVTCVAMNDISM